VIRIGSGSAEYVHDVRQALDYLHGRWPLLTGPHMQNAKLKCQDANKLPGNHEVARQAFIAAAVEAEVLS
jgi:hypothetical protein